MLAMRTYPDRPGLPFAAANVKLDEVAIKLGLTRTALYRRWETQHDFWRDLSRFLVLQHDYPRSADDLQWRKSPEPIIDKKLFPALLEALRTTVGDLQRELQADMWVLVRACLFAYDDLPEIASSLRALERDRIRDLARQLQAILDGSGYRFTEPLDGFGAATALWCLADGLTVRAWHQPAIADATILVDDGDGPKPWTLLAYSARALLLEGTTRGPAPTDAPDGTIGPSNLGERSPLVQAHWTAGQIEALRVARDLFLDRVDPTGPTTTARGVSALGQVTIASVARECGVSRRAVHNIWPSSDSLRLDLLTALLRAERQAITVRFDTVLAGPSAPHLRSSSLAAALVRRPATGRLWVGHPRLAYLVDGRHPGVQVRNVAGTDDILDEYERCLARLYPPGDRPSNETLDDRMLATLVSCLAEGANRLVRVLPEALADQRPGSALSALIGAWVSHNPASSAL